MKKQRPTIPVFEWKLATNLEVTRDIQNQEDIPAYGCTCKWCEGWKSSYKKLLPNDLQEQLLRVGIQLENPTDLYEYDSNDEYSSVRVIYHAVGKILDGPNQWTENEMGKILMYKTIKEEPYISLVVFPQKQSFDPSPKLKEQSAGELIRIDFRLDMPNKALQSDARKSRAPLS